MPHMSSPADPPEPDGAAPHTRTEGPATIDDLRGQYRCTFLYADDVVPPLVPGETAIQTVHPDLLSANSWIEAGVARTDLGRILLEQRLLNDVEGRQDEWRVLHSWARTGDGWRLQ